MTTYPDHTRIAQTLLDQQGEINELRPRAEAAEVALAELLARLTVLAGRWDRCRANEHAVRELVDGGASAGLASIRHDLYVTVLAELRQAMATTDGRSADG